MTYSAYFFRASLTLTSVCILANARRDKVDGKCAYGSEHTTCRTAGVLANRNYTTASLSSSPSQTLCGSALISQPSTSPTTHSSDNDSITSHPDPVDSMQPMCVVINPPTPKPPGIHMRLRSQSPPSDESTIILNEVVHRPPTPIVDFGNPPAVTSPSPTHRTNSRQDNCDTLAQHLYSHIRRLQFNTKAEAAKWCRSHIVIDIIWSSNTISLMNTANTKLCRLCAAERMVLGHNFNNQHWSKKILNLKDELRGVCSCKTRFLWFSQSDLEGGL